MPSSLNTSADQSPMDAIAVGIWTAKKDVDVGGARSLLWTQSPEKIQSLVLGYPCDKDHTKQCILIYQTENFGNTNELFMYTRTQSM